MKDKVLYTKQGNFKVKVGRVVSDPSSGTTTLVKHKPHYMKIVGGYGIQKFVLDEKGKEWDLQAVFKKHPELIISIPDIEREATYYSDAKTWSERGAVKNYGMGAQIFLSTEYMKQDIGQLQLI